MLSTSQNQDHFLAFIFHNHRKTFIRALMNRHNSPTLFYIPVLPVWVNLQPRCQFFIRLTLAFAFVRIWRPKFNVPQPIQIAFFQLRKSRQGKCTIFLYSWSANVYQRVRNHVLSELLKRDLLMLPTTHTGFSVLWDINLYCWITLALTFESLEKVRGLRAAEYEEVPELFKRDLLICTYEVSQ